MLTQKDQIEYELLQILHENEQPLGSSTLNLMLKERNIEVSVATIGRMLGELDYLGLTQRQGYRGRMLTHAGNERRNELQHQHALATYSSILQASVDTQSKDDLLDVLMARRGVEREIARLAALNATQEDVLYIQEMFELQSETAASGRLGSETDVAFHRAIAAASKNKVLAAAYDFIWQNGKFSPIMEYVRTAVGGKVAVDHGKILSAIAARHSAEAEQAMVAHIDSLISDVNKYWQQAQKPKSRKRKTQ